MERPSQPEQEAASRALGAYLERRRRRRSEDTYFGSSSCLLAGAEAGTDTREREHRRLEILEEAVQAGMSTELAEQLYDVAREEGLDPALGYELVRCGIGVMPPPEGLSNAPSQPSSDPYTPEWVLDAPIPPDELLRERTLRLSFRRLRALLEQHEDADQAFRAFAQEPDVGVSGY